MASVEGGVVGAGESEVAWVALDGGVGGGEGGAEGLERGLLAGDGAGAGGKVE